jgi:hypothetical protein
MFAVFHDGHRFGADVQLEGRCHWHIYASTCQSGLLHMFQDRIGQQTGDFKSKTKLMVTLTANSKINCIIKSSAQVATVLCVQECQTSSAKAFSISGTFMGKSQTTEDAACSNDYLLFPGGFSYPVTTPLNPRDRFCGTLFAQRSDAETAQTVCSKFFLKK